jgi:hypothetical protein
VEARAIARCQKIMTPSPLLATKISACPPNLQKKKSQYFIIQIHSRYFVKLKKAKEGTFVETCYFNLKK